MIDANAKFVLPLSFSQAQRILLVLVEKPYREVADLVTLIEQVANAAVKGMEKMNGVDSLIIPAENVNGAERKEAE